MMLFKEYRQKPLWIVVPDIKELLPDNSVQALINDFVDKLDLKDVEDTYQEGGCPPYHPSVLLKVVLYAYSRNIYGCRPIADLCRTDMVCQWFTNFESPSFSTINRFRSEHLGLERTLTVFEALVRRLVKAGLICFEECTYVDGTTIESRASRTKIVWAQNTRRFAENNNNKIYDLIGSARRVQQQDQDLAPEPAPNGKKGQPSPLQEQPPETTLTAPTAEAEGRKKKRTRDVHLPVEEVERIRKELQDGTLELSTAKRKELEERLDRADRYRQEDQMLGDKSGAPTTDPDSVAMHPKDDLRHMGPCLPMYNMQFMTQGQFILSLGLFGHPTDMAVAPLFLQSLRPEFIPAKIAADGGYGSYVNCTVASELGITPFFKYSLYDKESAPNYTPNPYITENLIQIDPDTLGCPGGTLKKFKQTTQEQHGVIITTSHYRTDQCANCPLRPQCHKKDKQQDYREVARKDQWQQMKPDLKKRLDSDEGQQLLARRSQDVEPTFAHTKWAAAYKRFRHFGIQKCTMDILLWSIAHNLKKLSKMARKGLLGDPLGPTTSLITAISTQITAICRLWAKIRAFSTKIKKSLHGYPFHPKFQLRAA